MNIETRSSIVFSLFACYREIYIALCDDGRFFVEYTSARNRITKPIAEMIIDNEHYYTLQTIMNYGKRVEYFWKKLNPLLPYKKRFLRNEQYFNVARWRDCSKGEFTSFLRAICVYYNLSRLSIIVDSRISTQPSGSTQNSYVHVLTMSSRRLRSVRVRRSIVNMLETVLQKIGPQGVSPNCPYLSPEMPQVELCEKVPTTSKFDLELPEASREKRRKAKKKIESFFDKYHLNNTLLAEIKTSK